MVEDDGGGSLGIGLNIGVSDGRAAGVGGESSGANAN